MKQNKDFNSILDECLERLFRGETVEQCLRNYPAQAAELEPLLRTASAVKRATAVSPNPVFRARAREEFHAALQDMNAKREFHFLGLRAWATAAIAIALGVFMMGSGTVALAGNSMPGEVLYPVKLATEQVQVVLTFSEEGKAELYASLADKRVNEIVYVAAKGDAEQVNVTSKRLDTYVNKIAVLVAEPVVVEDTGVTLTAPTPVTVVPPATPSPASTAQPTQAPTTVLVPATLTNANIPAPATVTTAAPGSPEKGISDSTGTKKPMIAPATTAIPAPQANTAVAHQNASTRNTTNTANTLKNSRQIDNVKVKAAENIQKLNNALQTAPESAKSALKNAIANAEASYNNALGGAEAEDTVPEVPSNSK